jgi:hypothetical protein
MAWILFVILQAIFIAAGIRNEQRAGLWSWSKFAFALGFAALEVTILIGPIIFMNVKSPRFMPVFIAAWAVAALNFIWMILASGAPLETPRRPHQSAGIPQRPER